MPSALTKSLEETNIPPLPPVKSMAKAANF
jgi:hypothetical protein